MKEDAGWIGVDLDATLAQFDRWRGECHIGEPVESMVALVKAYLAKDIEVRIFTARVGDKDLAERHDIEEAIGDWCEKHIGKRLRVTAEKDLRMIVLYDDRCIQVEPNTGVALVDYYRDAADLMNSHLEEIRVALGLTNQKDIMAEIRRLVK